MSKTILITGATDGIGFLSAEKLATDGHNLLVHGRNADKLEAVTNRLSEIGNGSITSLLADLSDLTQVNDLANRVITKVSHLDVVINNAGIFKTAQPITSSNMDVRFVVNTIAPYLLTKKLLSILNSDSRVINLSSAAQETVNLEALRGDVFLEQDFQAYAQSKLAITMWTKYMADNADTETPVLIAVNPGSLLGSKMVTEGFGVQGNDISIGADILIRAALDAEFAESSGQYFDNDIGKFSNPHPSGMNAHNIQAVVAEIEQLLT